MLNKYKIIEDYVVLFVTNRKGEKFEILVDLDDLPRLQELDTSWHTTIRHTGLYYAQTSVYLGTFNGKAKYKIIQLHRFIMNVSKDVHVDHINHNSLDCRKRNLRCVTVSQNATNRRSFNPNNKSGYRNVSWNKQLQKWAVQLQINGTNKVLGNFDDVDLAGEFAKEMRHKYYGQYAGKG